MLDNFLACLDDVGSGALMGVGLCPLMTQERAKQEDRTTLLDCQACLHPGTTRIARLDDNGRTGEAGHHGVSLRKSPASGFLAGPELRDHGALAAEFVLEIGVLLWKVMPQPGADDRHGSSAGLTGSAMGGRVDPRGEPTDDDIVACDEVLRDLR